MKGYLGIDGGGTGSRALLVDEEGAVCWQGNGAAANCRGMEFSAFLEVLDRHHEGALSAGLDLAGAGLGLTGIVKPEWAERIRGACASRWKMDPESLVVESDIRSAHRGGFLGKSGIALISGTGSSCLGRDGDGNWYQCGGWGGLLDDVGSGYGMALGACRLAIRMADGREERTPLQEAVFAHFGKTGLPDLVEHLHDSELSKGEVASLFPKILELAGAGERVAEGVVENGIGELIQLIKATTRAIALSSPDVVLYGGLLESPGPFRNRFEARLRSSLPETRIVLSALPAAAGALLGLLEDRQDFANIPFAERIRSSLDAISRGS